MPLKITKLDVNFEKLVIRSYELFLEGYTSEKNEFVEKKRKSGNTGILKTLIRYDPSGFPRAL